MNRLTEYLHQKQLHNETINIAYLVAGYPSIDYIKSFILKLDQCAIDVLELGIPYSDPLADGKIISESSFIATQNGVTSDTVFNMLREVKGKVKKPLVFLLYYNLILAYGIKRFVAEAEECGVQGFIVADLPYEESEELFAILNEHHIALIPLVAPTSENRIEKIVQRGDAFIYAVGSIGITGGKQIEKIRLKEYIKQIQTKSTLPVAVGFGVKTKGDIATLREFADGVIVGSAIVKASNSRSVDELIEFCNQLFAK